MRIDVLTLFPGMLQGFFDHSILKRAVESGVVDIHLHNFRDYAMAKHHCVDDSPFGGGPGMVLMAEPIFRAVEELRGKSPVPSPLIYLSPKGERFNQDTAGEFSRLPSITLLCGRYEGVDQRVIEHLVDREVSVGDFVLSGGESAAAVVIDAVVRLIPGVLGGETSLDEESFSEGLLEYPHYTRPAEFRGWKVPEVLLSGDHEAVRRWRRERSIELTRNRRFDLLPGPQMVEANHE